MKVSIVTINYNNLVGLQKTRTSIVSQTYKDYEWIVIDGGSTDGAKEFLQEHSEEMAYWCCEKDKGVYNAQNKGIAKAKGDYVICMNSGDCFHSSSVLEDVFSQNQTADILYGDWLRVYPDGRKEMKEAPKVMSPYFFYYSNICHQAMFVKTSIMQENPFDESYMILADKAEWCLLKEKGYYFCYVTIIVCDFEAGNGLSERINEQSLAEQRRIEESIPQYVKKDFDSITKDLREHVSKLKDHILECDKSIEAYKTDNEKKYQQLVEKDQIIKEKQRALMEMSDRVVEMSPVYGNKYAQMAHKMTNGSGFRQVCVKTLLKILCL